MPPASKTKKKKSIITIDIGKYGGPIFLGRTEGAVMRDKFSLDECDDSDVEVAVIFPPTTKGIGSSFFLAMFGPSIRKAGSKAQFLEKYKFSGPEFLIDDLVPSSIERSLFDSDLFGSNAPG